jgi:hypothetical protein
MMAPSPGKLFVVKLNWSLAFQISVPPPPTVQTPLVYEADPASAGEPISSSLQPDGKAAHDKLSVTPAANTTATANVRSKNHWTTFLFWQFECRMETNFAELLIFKSRPFLSLFDSEKTRPEPWTPVV